MQDNNYGVDSLPDTPTADATVELHEFRAPSPKTATTLEDRMVQAGVYALLDYDSDDLLSSAESVVKDIYAAMKEVELKSQAD